MARREAYWGGYSQKARRAEPGLPLPDGLDTRQAMAAGTAGSRRCWRRWRFEDVKDGPVLVTERLWRVRGHGGQLIWAMRSLWCDGVPSRRRHRLWGDADRRAE
jgi:hypothetical protein